MGAFAHADLGADRLALEGLADWRQVADYAALVVAVPSAQDMQGFLLSGRHVREGHGGARIDRVGADVGEVRAAGACLLELQLVLATVQDLLLFLGELVFRVFRRSP